MVGPVWFGDFDLYNTFHNNSLLDGGAGIGGGTEGAVGPTVFMSERKI